MLYRILRGPKYGQTVHLPNSQEINALLLLGDIEPLPDPDLERAHGNTPIMHPTYGWRAVRESTPSGNSRVVIVFHDGCGGRTVYSGPPGPTKVYQHDPQTGFEGYVWQKSDCPEEVVTKWRELSGPNVDPEWIKEEQQRLRNEHEAEQAKQDNLARAVINTGKVL